MTEPKVDGFHPEGLTPFQEALCLELFDIGAVKPGNFRLKLHERFPEAPLSPIYINLRLLRRVPPVKSQAVDVYEELVKPLEFDLLADVPTAATTLVSSLSDRIGVGMITPRTDAKTHGSGAKIDGLLPGDEEKRAVLVDDLVTQADSKLEAVAILREYGLEVEDVVVLIDREQGGREELENNGLRLHAAFSMQQMLDFYLRSGKITQEEHIDIQRRLSELNAFLGRDSN